MSTARERYRQALRKYQRQPNLLHGVLGNAANVVTVPNRPDMVYVTVAGSGVREVFNKRVPAIPGLQVSFGYDPVEPDVYQVLGEISRPAVYGTSVSSTTTTLHGDSHNWAGTDPVFVEKRQLMPLRPTPIGGMRVFLTREIARYGQQWLSLTGAVVDLGPIVPVTGSRYALIYEDIQGERGILTGVVRDLYTMTLADAPAPYPGTLPIALVRLYSGQTAVQEALTDTDLLDVRQLFSPVADVLDPSTIKLDDLATPDDNTDLNASTSRHGLLPKLSNVASQVLNGVGAWVSKFFTFKELTDVPASYTGQGLKLVRVKSTEDGLEFAAAGAGSGDVAGPESAVDGHLAVFDGTTGKLIKDGGPVPVVPVSPKVRQFATSGAQAYTFDLNVNPVEGNSLLLFTDSTSAQVSNVTCTNVTWTQLATLTSGGGSYYSLWVGIVGANPGKTISLTRPGSYNTMSVLEVEEVLTPTLGTYDFKTVGGSAFESIPNANPGRLVVLGIGPDNTTYTTSLYSSTIGSLNGYLSGIVSLAVKYETDDVEYVLRSGASGAMIIAEVS